MQYKFKLFIFSLLFLLPHFAAIAEPTANLGWQFDVNDTHVVADHICDLINKAKQDQEKLIKRETIESLAVVSDFYKDRSCFSAWLADNQQIISQADELLAVIKKSLHHGLDPQDYHLSYLELMIGKLKDKEKIKDKHLERLARIDVLLTDAYFTYLSHMRADRLHKLDLDPQWHIEKPEEGEDVLNLKEVLKKGGMAKKLNQLIPKHKEYKLLQEKLQELLNKKVKSVSPEYKEYVDKIAKIKINMERWRWLPRELDDKYILVNIANFSLNVIENDESKLKMKVIVGKTYRETPVFTGEITYAVFNPKWRVPKSIAIRDELPRFQKNAQEMVDEGFVVFDEEKSNKKPINPLDVNWQEVSKDNFIYRMHQESGPTNPLGKIKFMFPNEFDVYLHDTPLKELFKKDVRTFSSGCIRLEEPVKLAEYLFGKPIEDIVDENEPEKKLTNKEKQTLRKKEKRYLDKEKIQKILEEGKTTTKTLPEPMRVYILYITAWVDENGKLQVMDDIYGRDKKVDEKTQMSQPQNPCKYGFKCWFKNLFKDPKKVNRGQ